MYSGAVNKSLVLETATQGRVVWATLVALVMHLVGLVGMIWIDKVWFSVLTPLTLLLMVVGIVWTQSNRSLGFLLAIAIAFTAGMATESIGVNTGLLFGDYQYGTVLGPRILGVPMIIGFNWFMVSFSAAAATELLLDRVYLRMRRTGNPGVKDLFFRDLLHVSLAAVAATAFDWVMEPVAVELGFWSWTGGQGIPFMNYACWFMLSWLLVIVMKMLRVDTRNHFASNLFLIQTLFFGVLRLLL
jgi:putative membrane protein